MTADTALDLLQTAAAEIEEESEVWFNTIIIINTLPFSYFIMLIFIIFIFLRLSFFSERFMWNSFVWQCVKILEHNLWFL